MHNVQFPPSPPQSPAGSESIAFHGPRDCSQDYPTPAPYQAGPKPRHAQQAKTNRYPPPPTPESRIGIFLGKSLQLRSILGTGAYGVVYSAFDYSSNTWYAVKALSKTNPNGEPLDRRQREFQSREIQLHYAASAHPNIVSMLKIVDDPECIYVILEFCPEGDLFSNITEKGIYVSNDTLVKRAFLQILDAVEHCHRLGIYHRDLKPENILVSNGGHDVLLADFGLATTEPDSGDHGCGSTFYMSPECLDQSSRKPSYRCAPNDVWSLGVILVNLTCGRNPWKHASDEDSTYKAFKKDPDFLKTILPLSDELNDILREVFQSEPEDRISVSDLKNRIYHCQSFSAPSQKQGRAPLATPPTSPHTAEFNVSNVSSTSSGSQSSYDSDEGSMFSSGSSSSDESDFCESPEASPTSMDVEPPPQPLEDNSTSRRNTHPRQALADVTDQMPFQYYSLPQNGNTFRKSGSPCYPQYEQPYPYNNFNHGYSVYYPVPGFYQHHPLVF